MVRASINPEAITGKRPTKETALKMVSSGSVLNAPAFTGYAANKIVGFNRATVQPKPNNLQALISNLSSSVSNNITNIQNVLGEKKEPKERKGLFGFFGNLKETISLIQFLGSKKNLDKLKENLENLKDTFFESFEAVKAIRKVIKKIYDQLSGMESLSSGGGGGGNLLGALSGLLGLKTGAKLLGKKPPAIGKAAATVGEKEIGMLPKALKFLGSPGKMLLGAGALAAGGTLAETSGLAAPGGEEAQAPDQSQTEISGSVLDKFNSVLERFDKALDSLLKGKPGTGAGASKSSSAAGTSGGGGGGGGGAGPMPDPYDIPNLNVTPGSVPTLENFKKVLKGTPMEAESEQVYKMALSEGLNPAFVAGLAGAESSFGSKGKAVGRNNPFNYGVYANQTYGSYAESVRGLARALRDPKGYYYGEGRTNLPSLLEKYAPSSDGNNNLVEMRNIMNIGKEAGGDANAIFIPRGFKGTVAPILPSAVQPTQQPRSALAAPGKTGQPQVSFVNLGGETQAQAGPSGSGIIAPPAPPQNGPTAPPGVAFNPDNFLVLYSRMVYNIVDG